MAERKQSASFDFNGRPATIEGANVGSPSDPLRRHGTPRSVDPKKRDRMLARKGPKGGSRGRRDR